jgi:A/G-specific adenine glycosylase
MLEEWFLANKRSFPWRENPTPYQVWVSEVMLQQTRASVVITYFKQWMEKFPTIVSLGNAPLEEVIKTWEGLGYYSRARNLHAAAKIIIQSHQGEVPSSKEHLSQLPGLGPYTVGAILSFGFQQRAVAIDGNVARVMARFVWIDEEIRKSSARRKIEVATDKLLNEDKPWVTMEALIELGATVCMPTPHCELCPLQSQCAAYARGMPTLLPIKSAGPKIEKITRGIAIVEAEGSILVRKNGDGLMNDLWEFPYFQGVVSLLGVKEGISTLLGEKAIYLRSFEALEHSFTRFLAKLFPYQFKISLQKSIEGFCWIPADKLHELPFSAGHRKLVKQLYTFA